MLGSQEGALWDKTSKELTSFKFNFLCFIFSTFYFSLLNSICRIDLVTAPSKGFIEGLFEIQIFPSQGKQVSKVKGFLVDKSNM